MVSTEVAKTKTLSTLLVTPLSLTTFFINNFRFIKGKSFKELKLNIAVVLVNILIMFLPELISVSKFAFHFSMLNEMMSLWIVSFV